MVDSLLFDAKVQMHENLSSNPDEYRRLLKELLVQGLIKMIEPTVWLKVRESDLDLVREVVDEAIEEYKAVMLKEVAVLEGKTDIPCTVNVDDKSFLPEWNADD